MKTFNIKGQEIKVVTHPDGRRGITEESMGILTRLIMQYGDLLKVDKEAIAMDKYLKEGE